MVECEGEGGPTCGCPLQLTTLEKVQLSMIITTRAAYYQLHNDHTRNWLFMSVL